VVDQAALTDEVAAGRINAVLDVTEPEVLPAESPLWDLRQRAHHPAHRRVEGR
jgi:phosphoglycerate dehydrogenase-like enzyme